MSVSYRCIKTFEVSKVDDDGGFTDTYLTVKAGSMWKMSDSACMLAGDVRLEKEYQFIEITKDDLLDYFELAGEQA